MEQSTKEPKKEKLFANVWLKPEERLQKQDDWKENNLLNPFIMATTAKKKADGTVDKRTKEGKAICERMAKARKEKNSLKNRIKRLFK